MGIMTFLRNRAGLLVVWAIGIALVAFLLGEIIPQLLGNMNANQNQVGKINGDEIEYLTFNQEVEAGINNMRQQMGGTTNDQMSTYVVENVWNQYISKALLDEEVDRIGLSVGRSELNDMVSGQNPSPQIIQSFSNPQTGQFDRNQLSVFLTNIRNEPANSIQKQQWENFLQVLKDDRLQQKYNQLVQNSVYVTSLEAKEEYIQRNKIANFSYVLLDYSSIPDSEVTITDADYQAYYKEHKNEFYNPSETRSVRYVVFDAEPTAADSLAVKEKAVELANGLAAAENDSLYATINSETKYPVMYYTEGSLSPALDSALFDAPHGNVVGPFLSNGTYEMAKVIESKVGPDSVTASHILLNPALEGGIDQATQKADSIKNLIQNGASFADLASQFGTDASREEGGSLGTFGRGAMIPEFENAVFDGNTGEVIIVPTQFGVHIIRIDNQKGSSKVVKAAIIDLSIQSSKQTLNDAYTLASEFFGKVNEDNFNDVATQDGYTVQDGSGISPMQTYIQDLENPRELIRWMYKAETGDLTDKVYELPNKYIVAQLSEIRKEGYLPLEIVKNDIKPQVINAAKAKTLTEKINQAASGASSLDDVSKKLDKTAVKAENIVFANPIIPGVAQESKVVGTVFGLQPNTLSKSIEGNRGVYMVSVHDFVNPQQPANLEGIKQQSTNMLKQRTPGSIFQVLLERADITDNRARFY